MVQLLPCSYEYVERNKLLFACERIDMKWLESKENVVTQNTIRNVLVHISSLLRIHKSHDINMVQMNCFSLCYKPAWTECAAVPKQRTSLFYSRFQVEIRCGCMLPFINISCNEMYFVGIGIDRKIAKCFLHTQFRLSYCDIREIH